MDYSKQNFQNGQVLTADCLNKMEDGIHDACRTCTDLTEEGVAADAKVVGDSIRELTARVDSSSEADMFGGYDRFYDSIARLRVNPTAPLEIPTYDGSGQLTHPCVRHFPDGWCGHEYWMVATPYPNSAIDLENPCLWYSDDGYDWSAEGIPNPLDTAPTEDGASVGYNSDPHLLLVGNTMEVWWRTYYQSGSNAGCEVIYRRTSTDGTNWGAREELFRVQNADGVETSCLCPVALYEDGIYKIWVVYRQECLRYYESTTGANWQYMRNIDVNNINNPAWDIWHFDINHTAKGYEFVGSYCKPGDYTAHRFIYYAVSEDNITYSDPVLILMPGEAGRFDERLLYRPSIVRLPDRVMVYYGAQDASLEWHIGQIEAPSAYLFDAVRRVGERVHGMETKLAALEARAGAAPVEGVMIVQSFEVSPWLAGYWKPETNGEMTIYGNFRHSQLIPLVNLMDGGVLPEITVTSSVALWPSVRVNYFNGNLEWIGFDMGAHTTGGSQEPTPFNWPAGAVYFAISANTVNKDDIAFSVV